MTTITVDRSLLEQALEALYYAADKIVCPADDDCIGNARRALRSALLQPALSVPWAELMRGVRVENNTVVISTKGGNDSARLLCNALLLEKKK